MIRQLVTLLTWLMAGVFSQSASAAVTLDDSPQGMTCYFYAKAAKLAWQRNGGDWIDAEGNPFGSKPYATQRVVRVKGRQSVEWDITRLARAWAAGDAPAGALFLRSAQHGGGIVNFLSREQSEKGVQPLLIVELRDGRRSYLIPDADTYFSCPNHRGMGDQKLFKVGGGHAAVLVFPFRIKDAAEMRKATLTLISGKQYGNGAAIDIFGLLLPSSDPGAVERGVADEYPADEGLAADPAVLFTEQFESTDEYLAWAGQHPRKVGEIVSTDTTNHLEPLMGKALRVTIPQGANTALNVHFRFAEHGLPEPEEAYFRYYLRLGETWNPELDGGKLPGWSGTYGRAGWGGRKSDGHNGWSARGAFFRQANEDSAIVDLRGIGSYVYHARMSGTTGEAWGWNQGPSGLLEKNRWYSIEQHVRLNDPGESNGVLRAWVDGQLVFDRDDIQFRDGRALKIESVWMNVYHGGMTPARADMTLFIDNLVIASKYIGPMRAEN